MNRNLQRQLARVLALVLTVLPWVAALAVPRAGKAEASLSSPFSGQSIQATQPMPSGTPSVHWAFEWSGAPVHPARQVGEAVSLERPDIPGFRRYLHFSRLQLDGG